MSCSRRLFLGACAAAVAAEVRAVAFRPGFPHQFVAVGAAWRLVLRAADSGAVIREVDLGIPFATAFACSPDGGRVAGAFSGWSLTAFHVGC